MSYYGRSGDISSVFIVLGKPPLTDFSLGVIKCGRALLTH